LPNACLFIVIFRMASVSMKFADAFIKR